jgi:DNA-binding HxlR family transcriptional regulator
MEKDGLIVRSDLSGIVPHVEYSLANPQGFAALNLLRMIVQWVKQTSD